MDVKRSAGSPLLLLLLLTGLHVKAQTTEASSQSTQDTSLPPTPASTGLAASKEDTSPATSSGTLVSDQQKTNTTTVQSNRNDTGIGTTTIPVSPFSSSNNSSDPTPTIATHSSDSTPTTANHSSDSAPTTANSTNTPGVSSNTIISTSATISINTTSGPSTPFPFNHTNGPTQNNTGTSPKVNETGRVSIAPTGSTPSTISTKGVTSPSKPAPPDTSASSGTKASPNTDPTVGADRTDATKNQGTSTTHVGTDHQVELSRALSPGSVAAITIIVIVLVLLIFGGAAYWKIRHSSYGRLLEDQDYGSLGNYNNPLYDDS